MSDWGDVGRQQSYLVCLYFRRDRFFRFIMQSINVRRGGGITMGGWGEVGRARAGDLLLGGRGDLADNCSAISSDLTTLSDRDSLLRNMLLNHICTQYS